MHIGIQQLKTWPIRPHTVWEGGWLRMNEPCLRSDGDISSAFYPYLPGWVDGESRHFLVSQARLSFVVPEEATPAALFEVLVSSAREVGMRPEFVRIPDPVLANAMKPYLEGAGIKVLCEEAPVLAEFTRGLGAVVTSGVFDPCRPEIPKLKPVVPSHKSIGMPIWECLVDAACLFWEKRAWEKIDSDCVVEAELIGAGQRVPSGMSLFSVLGSAGMRYGLAFYTQAQYKCMAKRGGSDPSTMPGYMWALTFERLEDTLDEDIQAWESTGRPYLKDDSGEDRVISFCGITTTDRSYRAPTRKRAMWAIDLLDSMGALPGAFSYGMEAISKRVNKVSGQAKGIRYRVIDDLSVPWR